MNRMWLNTSLIQSVLSRHCSHFVECFGLAPVHPVSSLLPEFQSLFPCNSIICYNNISVVVIAECLLIFVSTLLLSYYTDYLSGQVLTSCCWYFTMYIKVYVFCCLETKVFIGSHEKDGAVSGIDQW